jgi:hypothetical protein
MFYSHESTGILSVPVSPLGPVGSRYVCTLYVAAWQRTVHQARKLFCEPRILIMYRRQSRLKLWPPSFRSRHHLSTTVVSIQFIKMESTLPLNKDGARILPEGFSPCEDRVIVGARGRKIKQHVGNRRFLELVASELTDYAEADNKTEKSYVLAKVLYTVRRWKGDGLKVGFVKWDPAISRWIAPKDSVARVTVAQVSYTSVQYWLVFNV